MAYISDFCLQFPSYSPEGSCSPQMFHKLGQHMIGMAVTSTPAACMDSLRRMPSVCIFCGKETFHGRDRMSQRCKALA